MSKGRSADLGEPGKKIPSFDVDVYNSMVETLNKKDPSLNFKKITSKEVEGGWFGWGGGTKYPSVSDKQGDQGSDGGGSTDKQSRVDLGGTSKSSASKSRKSEQTKDTESQSKDTDGTYYPPGIPGFDNPPQGAGKSEDPVEKALQLKQEHLGKIQDGRSTRTQGPPMPPGANSGAGILNRTVNQ